MNSDYSNSSYLIFVFMIPLVGLFCLLVSVYMIIFPCSFQPAVQTIHVQFHEYRRRIDQDDMTESRIEGGFYEQAEVDWKMGRYERLKIPPFIDSRGSTVVHDFKYVWEKAIFKNNMCTFFALSDGPIKTRCMSQNIILRKWPNMTQRIKIVCVSFAFYYWTH